LLRLGFSNGVLVNGLLFSGLIYRLVRNFNFLVLNLRLDLDDFIGSEIFFSYGDHGSIFLLDSLNLVDLVSSTGGIRSLKSLFS